MATYVYNPMVAVNPEVTGSVIINGSGKLYAPEDESFTTPLTVTLLNGTTTNTITTNARGLTQAFSLNDYASVIFKDDGPGGTAPIDSARGVIEEVLARTATAEQHAADAALSAENAAQVTDAGVSALLADGGSQSGGHVRRLSQVPNPYVEGVPLNVMGHSYTMDPYPYGTKSGGEFYRRIRDRLHLGNTTSKGRSGSYAIDNFGRMISSAYDSGSGLWTPGTKGLAIVQNTINELGASQAGDSVWREQWRAGIRGIIAVMNSKDVKGYGNISESSGTWAEHTIGYASKGKDGKVYFTATTGGHLGWTVAGGDVAYIITVATLSSYAVRPLTFHCNGVQVGSYDGNGKKATYPDSVYASGNQNYTPIAIRVSGLNAAAGTTGQKTVQVKAAGTSGNAFVSGMIEPATNPPAVFLAKEPPRRGADAATYNANIAWYNTATDQIAAEFSNVTTVDLAPGWSDDMIASLDTAMDFHPNDKGHSMFADYYTAAINDTITDWVDGVVIL